MKQAAVLVLVILGHSSQAQAEVLVAPSLEWLADHCIDSGIYVVDGVKKSAQKNGLELTLSLKDQGLRGKPVQQLIHKYYAVRLGDPERDLVKKGDEFLLCFQHYANGEKRVVQTINLDHPQKAGFSVIAASCQLRLLKSKKAILAVFEGRLKSHPQGDPVEISDYSKDNRFELEGHVELFPAVWGGSSCFLRVPGDLVDDVRAESQRQKQNAAKKNRK